MIATYVKIPIFSAMPDFVMPEFSKRYYHIIEKCVVIPFPSERIPMRILRHRPGENPVLGRKDLFDFLNRHGTNLLPHLGQTTDLSDASDGCGSKWD